MIKQKTKISGFLLMTAIFISLILTNVPVTPKIRSVENDDDRLNQISTPKLSNVPVVEKWNYQSGATTIQGVAISNDGEYTTLLTNSNVTLFNKSSNIPMWTYTPTGSGGLNSVGMSGNGTYILASGDQYAYLLNNSIESPKTVVWTYDLLSGYSFTFSSISETGEDMIFVYNNRIFFFNNTYSSGDKKYEWSLDHPDSANCKSAKISADGKYIVYGSWDGCVYFFNTSAPTTYEFKFNTSTDVIYVDISADGKCIVAGNEDNEIYLLNTTDYQGKAMWNYTCPTGCTLAELGISAQGNRIVVGYNDVASTGTLCQFNNTYFTGNKIPIWSYIFASLASISSIDISFDEKYIIAGYSHSETGLDCTVLLNTTVTVPKVEIWTGLEVGGPNAKSVAISGYGEYFISLEANSRKLYLFYLNEPQTPPNQLQGLWEYANVNNINDLEISKTGEYVAAAIGTNITLFNKYSNATTWNFNSSISNPIKHVGISYDGKYIIGSNDQQVFLFNNTASGAPWNAKEMWKYPTVASGYGYPVDISDDGKKIVVGDGNAKVHLFNNSFSSIKQPEWSNNTPSPPNDVAISWNGFYFVIAVSSSIYLFNTSNPSTYEWSFDTTQSVKKVAIGYDISKNTYYIAAYNNIDNEVYLLNSTYENPKTAMWNFSITTGTVNDIEISDNGKYIVVGDDGGYVYVFNNTFSTDKKPEWKNVRSLDREAKSIDISSDGSYIVVGYSTTYDPDWGLVQLFDTSAVDPAEPVWWDLTKSVSLVAISGFGDHIAVATPNPHIYLYYRYVYIPPVIYILIGDDDSGDDEEGVPVVPFGNYYLIFIVISVISLIVLKKRKAFLKK